MLRGSSQPAESDQPLFPENLPSGSGEQKFGDDRKTNSLERGVGTTAEPNRRQEFDGDCHDDERTSGRKEAVDLEEEEIWNSSDFNLQVKAYIVNLLHSRSRLMKINISLQQSLHASEDSITALKMEYAALMKQLKSMNKLEENYARVLEELNNMQSTMVEGNMANISLKTQNNQLQKEIGTMQNQIETMNNKMCDILRAKEMAKKKSIHLNQLNMGLQQKLKRATMQLHKQDETIHKKELLIHQQSTSLEELNTILQGMKEKATNLESQLELALVNREGSTLNPDGTVMLATESCMSVAEELGLKTGFLQRVSDEVSGCVDLDVKVIEKSQTLTTDQHEAVRAVSSEIETVKVIHEDVMKCEHVKEDRLQNSDENIRSEVVKVIFNVTENGMTSNAVQESANHKSVERLENALEITTQLKDVAEVIRPENAKITHLIDVMDIIEPEEVKIKSMVVVTDTVNEISNHRDVVEVRRPTELGTVDLAKEVEFTGSEETNAMIKLQTVKDKLPKCISSQEETACIMLQNTVEIQKHDDSETVVRPDSSHVEVKAQVADCANFSRLEEELAADQSSALWLDASFNSLTKGALVAGAIGLGALILWKFKN